jgi:hypothetical protein
MLLSSYFNFDNVKGFSLQKMVNLNDSMIQFSCNSCVTKAFWVSLRSSKLFRLDCTNIIQNSDQLISPYFLAPFNSSMWKWMISVYWYTVKNNKLLFLFVLAEF